MPFLRLGIVVLFVKKEDMKFLTKVVLAVIARKDCPIFSTPLFGQRRYEN